MESHKVVHMSSVHPLFDVRIFHKECKTLDNEKYDVVLVGTRSAEEQPISDTQDGIEICIVPRSTHRFFRMTVTVIRVLIAAIASRGKVYHFHDPELIPAGIILKLFRNKVIYDAHEDLPLQIHSRQWIPFLIRTPLSFVFRRIIKLSGYVFDGIVAATPTIAAGFPEDKTVLVQNFPRLSEFAPSETHRYSDRSMNCIYVGGISEYRGAKEMIGAVGKSSNNDLKLVMAGEATPRRLLDELKEISGWDRTRFLGWQSRERVAQLLASARVGLVLFHPVPNHLNALPNKMFEYMSAGLPVVASNFPSWEILVKEIGCGLTVDPLDPDAISHAISWLLKRPEEAERMGLAGREAIKTKYNWNVEGEKLVAFYNNLLK